MKQFFSITILIVLLSLSAHSQQLPVSDDYLLNRYALSPANAGIDKGYGVFTSFRQNWIGIAGAPQTKTISFNGPMDNGKMGLGGYISIDQAGIFRQMQALLSYAYIVKISDNQHLRFGLSAGMVENYIDLSGHSVDGDPFVNPQSINKTNFNASFGLAYTCKSFNVGLVVPQLLETRITDSKSNNVYNTKRQFRAYMYKSISVCKNWDIEPIAVMNKTMNSSFGYEVAALITFQKQLWLTALVRNANAIGVGAGMQYKRMLLNYTYEFGNTGMQGVSSGTHDFSLGFLLGKNNKRLKDPIFLKRLGNSEPYQKW